MPGRLRQSGGRQRQLDLRWFERGHHARGTDCRAGEFIRRGSWCSSIPPLARATFILPPDDEIEAVYRALVVGTRDYVRKCGFRKVVIGVSGGIDSALVATIAADALGPENVTGCGHARPLFVGGQPSRRLPLADNLGIKISSPAHRRRPLTPIGGTLESTFAGLAQDMTEENLQARIRGNLLMALSNKFGSLVLSTGNKSEMAVGYCTLYGDMAGGLAVISDVPKTMVYELAEFCKSRSGEAHSPRYIHQRRLRPSLRPNQTDQDTLPPYEVLDRILKAYVEDLIAPQGDRRSVRIPAGTGSHLSHCWSIATNTSASRRRRG